MSTSNVGYTSTYFNSVCLTIAAFVFVLLIIFMYLKKDKVKGLTTNLFIMCLILNLSCILLEFIVPMSIKEIINTNDNAKLIYYIICKSYIVVALLWDAVYLLYTTVKVQNVKFYYDEEKNKFNKYAILVFGLLLIASISFVFMFDAKYNGGTDNLPYTIGGPLKEIFDIFTTVGSTYIIVLFTVYSFKIKNINMWQFYVVFTFYLCLLAIEYIFHFSFNHLSFVQSLIVITTYFTIESQDNKLLIDYNKAKEDAERANKIRTNFLVNMSHEIRTPMNTIIGFGESITNEDNLGEEAFRSDFENVTRASYDLLDLINKISYISKIDSGKVEVNNSNYYLSNLIEDLFNNIYYKSQEKTITLKLDVNNTIPNLYEGDSKKIFEILYYILLNAVDHINIGDIKLSINGTVKENNKIEMEYIIEHNGEFLNFELFDNDVDVLEMSNNLKDNTTYSSDMALLIVRLLVKLLNGKIELNNEIKNETRYIIKIEQTIKENTPIGDVSLEQIINKIKSQTLLDCSGRSVLFVDSNDAIVRMACNYLAQYKYNIVVANNVDECISNFKLAKYDIIFADYTMINASGRTIMDELIALGVPLPAVVALINNNTAFNSAEYNKGYDAYVIKPIVFNDLNNIIHNIYKVTGGGNQ